MKLLAIDLDGTLVDSAPDLAYAVDAALEALGLPAAGLEALRGWIGDGVDVLLQRALDTAGGDSEAQLDAALAEFSAVYAAQLFDRSRRYPGVLDTLSGLAGRGIRLACITNKRERFALELLERAGLRGAFDLVFGGDSLPARKPDPLPLVIAAERLGIAPADAVMVGDSHHDRDAADAAGFRFIWASYGYMAEPVRADGRRFEKINSFAELGELV